MLQQAKRFHPKEKRSYFSNDVSGALEHPAARGCTVAAFAVHEQKSLLSHKNQRTKNQKLLIMVVLMRGREE